jgi:hypothetical protein
METLEIALVTTHARNVQRDGQWVLEQWAEIVVNVPKDYDFTAHGPAVLRRLEAAAKMIGAPG